VELVIKKENTDNERELNIFRAYFKSYIVAICCNSLAIAMFPAQCSASPPESLIFQEVDSLIQKKISLTYFSTWFYYSSLLL